MKTVRLFTSSRMETPRAAAIAGIVFSVLLIAGQMVVRTSIPASPLAPVAEVVNHLGTVSLALNLVPFAGIAFLWFIAVMRDRLGKYEDRFFATVFLGSGLLYLVLTFVSAALANAVIHILRTGSVGAETYALARVAIYQVTNVFAVKMAAVFMITTCTIALRTAILPRWIVFLGYASAIILLLSDGMIGWTSVVFPIWVLLTSVCILAEKFGGRWQSEQTSAASVP